MSAPQECPTRVLCKSVLQERLAKVSHKSVTYKRPKFPTTLAYKSFAHECPTRVLKRVSPTRVSCKSVSQRAPPARVSYKGPTRVSNNDWPHVFECVCAFGSVGSIFFFAFALCGLLE